MVIRTYGSSDEVIYRGVLVDFGNAIYAGNRRLKGINDHVDACDDDARSANAYFLSLHAHDSRQLVEAYQAANANMRATDPRWPDFGERQRELDKAAENLMTHGLHGYIDDLESLLYCFCFEVGKRCTWEAKNNPAIEALATADSKRKLWGSDLSGLPPKVTPAGPKHGFFRTMVPNMARRIQKARLELAPLEKKDVSMTKQEHDCFRDVVNLMEKALRDTPEDEELRPAGKARLAKPDQPVVKRKRKASNVADGPDKKNKH